MSVEAAKQHDGALWRLMKRVALLRESPVGMIGAALVLLWILVAIFAPLISPYDPNDNFVDDYGNWGPSALYLAGPRQPGSRHPFPHHLGLAHRPDGRADGDALRLYRGLHHGLACRILSWLGRRGHEPDRRHHPVVPRHHPLSHHHFGIRPLGIQHRPGRHRHRLAASGPHRARTDAGAERARLCGRRQDARENWPSTSCWSKSCPMRGGP